MYRTHQVLCWDQQSTVLVCWDQASAVLMYWDQQSTMLVCWDQSRAFLTYWDQQSTMLVYWDQASAVLMYWDQQSTMLVCWDQSRAFLTYWDQESTMLVYWDQASAVPKFCAQQDCKYTAEICIGPPTGFPLTDTQHSRSFLVASGHDVSALDWAAFRCVPTLVLLMAGRNLPRIVEALLASGWRPETQVWALIAAGRLCNITGCLLHMVEDDRWSRITVGQG
jgi:hypothetical protein